MTCSIFRALAAIPLCVVAMLASPAHAQDSSSAPSAIPSATPSGGTHASPMPMPPPPTLEVDPAEGTASGQAVHVRVYAGTGEGQVMDLFALLPGQPSPRLLRSATVTAGLAAYDVRPDRNMGLYARFRDGCCTANSGTSGTVQLVVRASATLSATRKGTRDYTFTGQVRPAAGQRVTLWRVGTDGRRVLTSAGHLAADGSYRLNRRFTGSGRFGFQVDVAAGDSNAVGHSATRPTVIH